MKPSLTRRDFMGLLLAGSTWLAGGCMRRAVWPAMGSSKGVVRLVFYTDVHTRLEWETPRALAQATCAINAQKPDLVIAGGDLITDGFESTPAQIKPRWDAYMQMQHAIAADVYPVIGNHDLVGVAPRDGSGAVADPRADFRTRMAISQTFYSFNALGYHFVVLDSIQPTSPPYQYRGFIDSLQLQWLARDLARVARSTPIVVALHIPLLTTFYMAEQGATSASPPNRVVVNNRAVLNILSKHNVILVLQGHLHAQEVLIRQNTTFIVGGAVCGKWWRGPWHGTEEGFNVITLCENRVKWEYIDYGWEALRPKGV